LFAKYIVININLGDIGGKFGSGAYNSMDYGVMCFWPYVHPKRTNADVHWPIFLLALFLFAKYILINILCNPPKKCHGIFLCDGISPNYWFWLVINIRILVFHLIPHRWPVIELFMQASNHCYMVS
jgi:hypothetical protein